MINPGLTLPIGEKSRKRRPLEDSWGTTAKKRKPGNNKWNYRKPQKVNCNFNQVEKRKITWMYNAKFLDEQVGTELKK